MSNKLFLLPSIFIVSCLSALSAHADYKAGYYDAMEGKSKEALKSAAKTCVQKHTRLDYYNLPGNWIYTDLYPERYNGDRRWWEMYSDLIYLIKGNQSGNSSFSANKMQREHSIPKSWWKKNGDVEYTPAYTDMWNLYPSDGEANMEKSNYPLGECAQVDYDNGVTKVGSPKSGLGGGCGRVFEPADQYKGDFARTVFYMATVYDDLPWVINYMFNANSSYPTLRPWAYEMLLQWARLDPVSQKERDRNDGVESQQGNRNPFIDFPELAEYIWGVRTSEVFRIADQGGHVTPPLTGDPEITAPVNGEALDFGQAAVGGTISRELEIRGANLTSPLSVSLSGSDRKMFTLTASSINPSQINAAGVYRLQVLYSPTTVGKHHAAAVIYDGGLPAGQSIAVLLEAEGCEVPVLTRLTAAEATQVTDDSYMANWTAAPEAVDYYEVNRVRYFSDGEEGDLLESDTNSLLVSGRDPLVAESYSVCSVRLGYRSEASNSIVVNADSGVGSVSLPAATYVVADRGRWRLVTNLQQVLVSVFDVNGTVISSGYYTDGEFLNIPENRFLIIMADGLRCPQKINPALLCN